MRRATLNHTYRLIWNELTQAWVAVAEFVRGRCKRSGGALVGAIPLAFSAQAFAGEPGADALPDIGEPAAATVPHNLQPSFRTEGASVTWQEKLGDIRLKLAPEYSERTGSALGGSIAFPLTATSAAGILLTAGSGKKEILLNTGIEFMPRQRLLFTLGQLRQTLKFDFRSGAEQVEMTQNSRAISYQFLLGQGLVNALEFSGYRADTPSRDLTDKTFAVDSPVLYELWNDPRRIAGGKITGFEGKVVLAPIQSATLKLGLGVERLEYDLLVGQDIKRRATGSVEWNQRLDSGYNLRAALNTAAAQNTYGLGLSRRFGRNGQLGLDLLAVRGRDGGQNDRQIRFSYTYSFGGGSAQAASAFMRSPRVLANDDRPTPNPSAASQNPQDPAPWSDGLIDLVAQRPSYIPAMVIAKVDTSALPTRLVEIDKTALPAGSTIDAATGDISVPLGVAVTGFAGITKNLAAFTNSGQFALGSTTLTVRPSRMVQPAGGMTDTYIATIDNAGGGTTYVTIVVSKGSVHIDSIVVTRGAAPTASNVGITGVAQVGQTLTGHYTYADANNDPQGTSTFRWLRNGTAIAGATATTYTLVAADQGNTITFEVTPVSTVAPTMGTAVVSVATASVAGVGVPAAPTASAVTITGTAQVGQTLTGSYTYADANNDPQGTSIFRWLRNGSAIAGATAATYTLVAADQGNTITFEVTPVSTVAPTAGTAVVSAATAAVLGVGAPAAPTASNVAITGTVQVGQTLTGSYTYADINNDSQGTSTFRWLRNGVAITGATTATYTLVAADQGTNIIFEVTPVSTVAPTTGTAVASAATAAVLGVGAPAAPTASDVVIAGTAQVGQTLAGSYSYADANNDPPGTSTFRWLRNGTAIAGATAATYLLVAADQGNTITFEVTPVSTVAPTTGAPVLSAPTTAVASAGTPVAPTASNVVIAGTAQVGQTLTGSYSYADANNDPQGTSTFRWLRSGVAITGATAATYTLVSADQGNTITFEVTAVSTVAPTTGTPVLSAPTTAVTSAGTSAAPTASNVVIAGPAQVGQTLTGGYTYTDVNNDPQGTSTFRWLRSGVAITGATAATYTLVAADQGNTITFEVTPVSTVAPTTGTAVVSAATAAVAGVGIPAAPTASNVVISGTAQVGQTLTGSYTYADANDDPQGSSTFRWLRSGVVIAGATAATYTLVSADQGNAITFEVTPVSTVAPTTGTAVTSAATTAVVFAPAAPTASNVAITGTAQVGLTLTGSYTYADINGDPQRTSTFRWLRNGVAIAGATAPTYLLVLGDQGNAITFEVTPVSTVTPTTGTAVVSSATSLVALPAGYVQQGGLIWTPNNIGPWRIGFYYGLNEWNTANTYCSTATILGQTGWRLPTQSELSALSASGMTNGQGWTASVNWSSTPGGVGIHGVVSVDNGWVGWRDDSFDSFVSCVR